MHGLTTTDAFFVAYQERSKIHMHLGAELELAGPLDRAALDAAIASALERWPALGSTLARRLGGLAWRGAQPVLTVADDVVHALAWREHLIDPWREPPFGVLWIARSATEHTLAFRCHHAVADGMLFLAIVAHVLDHLRGVASTAALAPLDVHPLAWKKLRKETSFGASWRHMRTLSREAKEDRSARVALRAETPGAVASCDRRLADKQAIERRAKAVDVRPPWIACAAWLRAVNAWNARRGVTNTLLSVEIPVNMRRGPQAMTGTGNHLTVLTLFGDATKPQDELARSLWDDYVAGIRRRDHLAVSFLGAPVRVLPWGLFKRVAVTTTSTGFATTHFTWVEHERDFRNGNGALVVRDQHFYTPVCLRMGAALGVMAWPDELQLAITYRTTGLTADDANELADLLRAELS